jgi:hypothetical protein
MKKFIQRSGLYVKKGNARYFFCIIAALLVSCNNNDKPDLFVIPFSLENGRIIMEATINGQNTKFMFDTGSIHSFLGINARGLLPIAYTKQVYNGKQRTVLIYALNKITFNGKELRTHSWLINKSDSISYNKEYENCDGILGIRAFEGYWCELSFSKNQIILHKEKPADFVNYAPLKTLSKYDALYLPITIDGSTFYMNIDTGLQYSAFFPGGIIEYKNSDEYREINSIDEVKQFHLVKTNSIQILDETISDAYIMTNSYSAQRRNFASHNDMGLLGVDFLQYYDLLFDYRDLRNGRTSGMYYKSNTPREDRDYGFFSFLKEPPALGIIDFRIPNEGIRIVSILKDSLADTVYGIQPGTVITKINGKPILEFSREELLEPDFYRSVHEYSVLEDDKERTIVVPPMDHEIPPSN